MKGFGGFSKIYPFKHEGKGYILKLIKPSTLVDPWKEIKFHQEL